jgi:hypothetical protein
MEKNTNEDAVKIALLRKTIKDLIAGFGGQQVDPECNCGDCVYLRPLEAALKATE